MPIINKFSRRTPKKFNIEGDKSFYHTTAWRKLRKIKKSMNPFCEVEGCYNPTHTIDHVHPITQGGAKLSLQNLQSLCIGCNGRKTRLDGKEGGGL
jgi:5-methylcytosine-specific restriction endonuclease McrA